MTPIEITFNWADVDQRVSSKALAKNYTPKWWVTLAIMLGGVGLAFAIDLLLFGTNGLGGVFGFVIACYACIFWNAIRFRIMSSAVRDSPARSGGVTMTLEQDGYRTRSQHTELWMAWGTVAAIKPAKGMIVLAIGDAEYVPILDSALPDGMTRQDILRVLSDLTELPTNSS